jgi:hypothetical protein
MNNKMNLKLEESSGDWGSGQSKEGQQLDLL